MVNDRKRRVGRNDDVCIPAKKLKTDENGSTRKKKKKRRSKGKKPKSLASDDVAGTSNDVVNVVCEPEKKKKRRGRHRHKRLCSKAVEKIIAALRAEHSPIGHLFKERDESGTPFAALSEVVHALSLDARLSTLPVSCIGLLNVQPQIFIVEHEDGVHKVKYRVVENDVVACTVFLDRLPTPCPPILIRRLCRKFGCVVDIKLPKGYAPIPKDATFKRRPHYKKFAFVQFSTAEEAHSMCEEYTLNRPFPGCKSRWFWNRGRRVHMGKFATMGEALQDLRHRRLIVLKRRLERRTRIKIALKEWRKRRRERLRIARRAREKRKRKRRKEERREKKRKENGEKETDGERSEGMDTLEHAIADGEEKEEKQREEGKEVLKTPCEETKKTKSGEKRKRRRKEKRKGEKRKDSKRNGGASGATSSARGRRVEKKKKKGGGGERKGAVQEKGGEEKKEGRRRRGRKKLIRCSVARHFVDIQVLPFSEYTRLREEYLQRKKEQEREAARHLASLHIRNDEVAYREEKWTLHVEDEEDPMEQG